jgi:AmmeMemoRadiSam system protein A
VNASSRSAIRTTQIASSESPDPNAVTDLLSLEDQQTLLCLAHESILSALGQLDISLDPPSTALTQARGVFTSLYLGAQLRGCVGYVRPEVSLYRAVAESARAAAFADTRFSPVTIEEAPQIRVELSVLSSLHPATPDEIEVGRHGLLITMNGSRGLLLPQVALEHGWDRTTLLEQTCRKAGLPLNAWHEGAAIEAFTAQVFGEKNNAG